MAVDIFGEYSIIIGQILSLAAILGITLQIGKWLSQKHLTRDFAHFMILAILVVMMQVVAILRFSMQDGELSQIESTNKLLNLQQIKLQNLTILNQGLIRHSLNETHVDNALIKKDLNNTKVNNKLILRIVNDLQFHLTNQSNIDNKNKSNALPAAGRSIIGGQIAR